MAVRRASTSLGRAFVAGDHQAPRVLGAADRRRVGQVDRGLGLVGEPDDRGQQARLGEGAHRFGAGVEARPPPALVRRHGGRPTHAHGHRGDDAEGSFRAEQQLAQVGAGGVGGRRAEVERTRGGRSGEPDDHRVEAAVAGARLAAGAGGREAADRGVLEGLRVVAERQAVLAEQRLGLRATQAGLERGRHRHLVDREQPLHPDQVEADQPGEAVATGSQAAGDAGASAERDDRDAVLGGPRQDRRDVAVPVRADDRVGCVGEVAGTRLEQVGRGLAAGAEDAGRVVDQDVVGADDRAEAVEQHVVERGRGRRRAGDGRALLEPEGQVDQAERRRGQVGGGGRVAPALRVHLDCGRPEGHALQCDTCRHFVTLHRSGAASPGSTATSTRPATASSTSAGGVRRSPRWPSGPGSRG